jgi:hypothetical protein
MNWMYCLRWVWHMLRYSCKVTGIIMYISNMYTLYIDKDSIELQTFSVQRWLCMLPPLLHCMTTHKHFNVTWARVRMLGLDRDGRTDGRRSQCMYLHITIVLLHFNEFFSFQSIPVVIWRIFEWMACFELWPLRGHVGGMATADALKIVRVVRCNSRFWAQWDTLQSRYFCFLT